VVRCAWQALANDRGVSHGPTLRSTAAARRLFERAVAKRGGLRGCAACFLQNPKSQLLVLLLPIRVRVDIKAWSLHPSPHVGGSCG
jgi:hypothetical protein